MGGIRLERRGDIAPPAVTDQYGGDEGTRVNLGEYEAGDCILLRARYAEAYINATSAPTPLAWEGPFVRIFPRTRPGDSASIWQAGDTGVARYTGVNLVAGPGPGAAIDGFTAPYYEFDANGCPPILLPFDCSLELYTERAGIWLYDLIVRRKSSVSLTDLDFYAAAARRYPHTRINPRTVASRTVRVPMGAVELQFFGLLDTGTAQTPIINYEKTGKTVGNSTSQLIVSYNTSAVIPPRQPCFGAYSVTLRGDGVLTPNNGTGVTFFCQIA